MSSPSPAASDISAAIQSGQFQAAEALARLRLRAAPADVDAHVLLGISLQMQGRLADAVPSFAELTRMQPEVSLHWNNLASALRDAGRSEEAEAAYRRALALAPRDAAVLENLGLLYNERGDYAAARVCFVAAVEIEPHSVQARLYGAAACVECTDMPTAERLAAPWWQWRALPTEQDLLLASVMQRLGHFDTAETVLQRALAQAADKTPVRVRLLLLYERANRVDEARALLAQLPDARTVADAELQDEIVNACAALAAREHDHARARALLEPLAGAGRRGAEFFFTLAKLRDRLGDADAAMEALERAHALQMEKAALLVPELIASGAEPLTQGLDPIDAASRAAWIDMPAPADAPVFIMGFPRSGTTLLEQMLDAVPALRTMDEQPFLQNVVERIESFGLRYPRDLHRLDAAQCEQLRTVYWTLVATKVRLEPGQRLVDKNPLNMLRLPLVNRLFPQAPIVFAMRHPCDVVLSCYMQSFGAPAFMLLCSTLQRLARGYANAFRGWNRNVGVLRPALLNLRHEDLLADLPATARRLGAFLGIDDVAPMLAFHEHARRKYIATPSYAQVTEPLNRKGVDRWRRYRRWLEPVLPELAPVMQEWGYDA